MEATRYIDPNFSTINRVSKFTFTALEIAVHYPSDKTLPQLPPRLGSRIKAEVSNTVDELPASNSNPRANIKACNTDVSGTLDLGDYTLAYRWTPTTTDSSIFAVLIILSNNGAAVERAGSSTFATSIEIRKKGRKTRQLVQVPWAIPFRLVALDEFHTYKDLTTNVLQAAERIRAHSEGVRFFLMSATPLSTTLESSVKGPMSLVLQREWNEASHPQYKLSYRYLMNKLVTYFKERLRRNPVPENRERVEELEKLFQLVMIRREADDCFNGVPVLNLPPLYIKKITCHSNIQDRAKFNSWITPLDQEWKAKYEQVRRNKAAGVQGDIEAANIARKSSSFQTALFATNLPGLTQHDFPPSYVADNMLSQSIGSHQTPQERSQIVLGRDIIKLVAGCGKLQALEGILRDVLQDRSVHSGGEVRIPFKKHALVICSRPGFAVALASYFDKSPDILSQWDVQLLTSSTPAAVRHSIIADNFKDIPFRNASAKPTLFISTVKVVGTGLNGLQRANHCIIWDPPFEDHLITQTFGRVKRSGQRYKTHGYILESGDTDHEKDILKRHQERMASFQSALGAEHGLRYGGIWME
ncbi:P-loop containing nucleoside triphosphate hydrolase protein [Echria macrotheca]|uniref:P-loop containing nucleoside triphosphate hydrolase protein n=1 Tax=Echria macrotheca TaxID=438768 RepID=A0AAJ0B3S0_9PEZI|nr:P-loop containing nucleoside triphosphate hydrolase protein [Echria macrotheca]